MRLLSNGISRMLASFWIMLGIGSCLSFANESGNPAFVSAPSLQKDGTVWRIRFAADRETDVAVAVLNAQGNAVRHLVAGMLGTNAPAPLKSGTLQQELTWDGKDDLGNPVQGNGFVRVTLGTRPQFGRVLFHEPGLAFAPRAVTPGPDGLLYVLMEQGRTKSTFLLQAYTKEGTYVRTVMPYPADLPENRLKGLERIKTPDGRFWPIIGLGNFRDLYPLSTGMRPQSMPISSDGRIVLANASKTHNAGSRPHHLLFVSTDGGIPEGLNYIGPPGSAEKTAHGKCFAALSPDEQWIYTSGHRKGHSNDDRFLGATEPHAVVYRIGWNDRELAKPFIGELFKPDPGEKGLVHPRGIAVDGTGRIYVCDRAANRVQVYGPDAEWIGSCAIENPDQVVVDRKSGAIYATTYKSLGYRKSESTLVKFNGIGAPPAYSVELGNSYPAINSDSEDGKTVIWLARTFWNTWESALPRRGIEKVVDLGDRFSEPVEVVKPRALPDVYQVAASPVNDDVFLLSYSGHRFSRVNGGTGESVHFNIKGQDLAAGPEGDLYVKRMTAWNPGMKSIDRYDRDGQPLAYTGTSQTSIAKVPGNVIGHGYTGSKGISVTASGEIVVLDKEDGIGISIFGADGSLARRKAVTGLVSGEGSPVMDLFGNLYVAAKLKPPSWRWPQIFGDQVPVRIYNGMYGSVVKFLPSGGAFHRPTPPNRPIAEGVVWPPENSDALLALKDGRNRDTYVENAHWVRPGFSHIAVDGCNCYVGRFDVDRFGRVFIPDVGQFSVLVADANNNELFRFGDYGNEDSAGPDSAIPAPEIPFSWPYAVSIGKSGVYVSDFINRRIVRVDLNAAAETTLPFEIKP